MSLGIGMGYTGAGITAAPRLNNVVTVQKFYKSTLANAMRIRLQEQPRNYMIIRNLSSYVAQIATTTVTNDNRNPATTGFIDIAPSEEWIEYGTTYQTWFRPKIDGQAITIEVEVSVFTTS